MPAYADLPADTKSRVVRRMCNLAEYAGDYTVVDDNERVHLLYGLRALQNYVMGIGRMEPRPRPPRRIGFCREHRLSRCPFHPEE